jgi:hypothetical protein
MRKIPATFCLLALLAAPAQAQSAKAADTDFNTREAIGIILLSGLGGGVLGLSTLSFYSKPEDHIQNIPIGAGIGVIASAIYLTVKLLDKPLAPEEAVKGGVSIYPWASPAQAGLLATLRF